MKRSPCTAAVSGRIDEEPNLDVTTHLKRLSKKFHSFSDSEETGIEELPQQRHDDELAVRVIRNIKNFVYGHAAICGVTGARFGREKAADVNFVWVF